MNNKRANISEFKEALEKMDENFVVMEIGFIIADEILSAQFNAETDAEKKEDIARAIYAIRNATVKK